MEEQIYQSVWCQMFIAEWRAMADLDEGHASCEEAAEYAADSAAAAAVRRWSAAKQLAAIVAANKEKP